MLKVFLFIPFVFLFLTSVSWAQHYGGAYVGGGAYFGTGVAGCGGAGRVKIPKAIKDNLEEVKVTRKQINNLEKDQKAFEARAKAASKKVAGAEKGIRNCLKTSDPRHGGVEIAGAVIQHIKNSHPGGKGPNELCEDGAIKNDNQEQGYVLPWSGFCRDTNEGAEAFSEEANGWDDWTSRESHGFVDGARICDMESISISPARIKYHSSSIRRVSCSEDCKNGILNLPKAWQELEYVNQEIENIKNQISGLNDYIDELEEEIEEDHEQYQDDLAEGRTTEAEICYDCPYGEDRPISTTDKVIGVAGTVLNAAATYYGTKYIVDQNKQAGWPTSPWLAYSMGYPFVMAGIYGAANGGAGGAYGCSPHGGMGGGGPFGYPGGWGGAGGGGAYPGYPGMAVGGAGGFAMGYPGGYASGYPGGYPGGGYPGGYPGGGYMIGAAGGIGGAIGLPGGYSLGYPGGIGYPGGFAGGFAYGGAGGFQVGAAGGYPGGVPIGFPIGGAGGFAIGGAGGFAVGGAGGFPVGGAGGYPFGAMIGGAGGFALGGAGGFALGGPASAQYQIQMQQLYAQQMQQWVSEQQRLQSDYANRTALIGRLQGELFRIQSQIQQIATGGVGAGIGFSGSGSFGIGSGVGGVPTGNVFPANGDPNLGTIPARGR